MKWLESPDGAAFGLFGRNNNNDDPEGLEEQETRSPDCESCADGVAGYWCVVSCSSELVDGGGLHDKSRMRSPRPA
ncbi:hypothetical protein CWT12_02070 [Actinomyces sp. 432]|nr:hypothetical protein CWT12_02070 [Actinomyces sp. 432]